MSLVGRTTMTGFLLDTCVLSETSKKRPHPAVVNFIETAVNISIPVAAIMEFQMGIMERCATSPAAAVKLSGWFQSVVLSDIPIIPTTREVAEVWGTLASDPRLKNLIVGDPRVKKPRNGQDIHIAAVAIVHRMAIATFNIKDFELIHACYPLPGIYHPVEEKWYCRMEPLAFMPTAELSLN